MAAHVVFVGLMGAGKTTVGRLVATALGRPLRDCDVDVQRLTGSTAADYARTHGIDRLHDREAEVLLAALGEAEPAVITAAASTIEEPSCRAALREAFVVWLRSDIATLAARASSSSHRPLDDDAHGQLRIQAGRREALFGEVADLVLQAGERDPTSLAGDVMSRLG